MSIKISNQRYEEIKRIVVRMFVKYGVSCVPINGFEIAHKMGIKVIPYSAIAQSKRWLLIKSNDSSVNTQNGVHFFVDDYRFNGIYNNPEKSLAKYSQYAFLLTPDFSTYADMSLWRQIESVAKNRWCGAYWQSKGLIVIPTISWSTPSSYDFCFDGVEENSIVAIGMIGCKQNRLNFMRGYYAMLEKIRPETIICFGTPFPEMQGNIVTVDYRASRKVER